MNPYSLTAEVIFGLLIIFANISHIISVVIVFGANHSSEKLSELNIKKIHFLLPLIIVICGFIVSFTIYTPGIYIASLLSILLSITYNRLQSKEIKNTERFEALIDAIIAIIITVIVLEIPIAANGNLESLFELKLEFIAYAVSFVVCFNAWNFTYNLFSIVKKINYPYLTTFAATNFHEFVPQFLYGVNFIIINTCSVIATHEMKNIDQSNEFLQAAFQNYNNYIINIIFTIIFMIIGYFYYPPIIMISCIFSIILSWIFLEKKINLLDHLKV